MTMTTDPELELFPVALLPRSRDAIAQYEWLTSRLVAAGYATALLALHMRALQGDPDLASLFRSPEALADVGVAAERYAIATAADRVRASASAVADFKRAIAEQLAAIEGHELQAAARRYLEILGERERKRAAEVAAAEQARAILELAAAEEREKARAERERLASEQAAAEERVKSAVAIAETIKAQYTTSRRQWLAGELQATTASELKVRIGGRRAKYDVQFLLSVLPNCTIDEVNAIGEAIAEAEANPS
jgi:hypothetical protein